MAEPKFKRGQTVVILSRGIFPDWENTNVGGFGIIERHVPFDEIEDCGDYNTDTEHLYSLWLMFDDGDGDGNDNRSCRWFEEKYLELYCSNEERGLKILSGGQLRPSTTLEFD
jgi:hypothetical protein